MYNPNEDQKWPYSQAGSLDKPDGDILASLENTKTVTLHQSTNRCRVFVTNNMCREVFALNATFPG
jgi:hypothetical protein